VELKRTGMIAPLLDPLYDAAAQPEMWKVFLQKASEVLRADKAAILVLTPGHQRTDIHADIGFSKEMRRDMEELSACNPWLAEMEKHRSVGWYAGCAEDELSMESFRKSKFYLEVYRKHNVEWNAAAMIFMPGGMTPGLTMSRSRTEQPFSTRDRDLLKQLVPHLRRAFKLHGTMTALRQGNAAGQRALDLIGAACISLDAHGRVLSMNRRAAALIADATALRIKSHRLLAGVAVEQNLLDACVQPACACGAGNSIDPGAGAVVLHSDRGTPLYLSALPYHSSRAFLENNPAALLFLTTSEEQGRGEHRIWQSMFGLSPAECRVAEMMKRGMDVVEISEMIKIKADTVRYYQKCVYRKTAVRGQGQLIRLLTRLPSSTP
jgi:DNA-binding CsgD family transcriptional regulator/PAS domain-containing protein